MESNEFEWIICRMIQWSNDHDNEVMNQSMIGRVMMNYCWKEGMFRSGMTWPTAPSSSSTSYAQWPSEQISRRSWDSRLPGQWPGNLRGSDMSFTFLSLSLSFLYLPLYLCLYTHLSHFSLSFSISLFLSFSLFLGSS